MKTNILLKLIILFATQLNSAQVLYSENFDNLAIGNVGTDSTGATAGKGGWYTLCQTDVPNYNNSYFNITNVSGRGNVLEITSLPFAAPYGQVILQKKDLHLLWNTRTNGNEVCKIEFDFYTESPINGGGVTQFYLMGNQDILMSPQDISNQAITGFLRQMGYFSSNLKFRYHLADIIDTKTPNIFVPENTWINVKIYLDYENNKIYLNIPMLNIWVIKNDFLINSSSFSKDNYLPKSIILQTTRQFYPNSPQHRIMYDNFILEALTTMPTVSLDNLLSSKFNLYPNPAKNIVNITNNENLGIELIKIYDSNGKLINTKTFSREPNVQLDISNYAAGTYFLHISSTKGTAIKKVIKE